MPSRSSGHDSPCVTLQGVPCLVLFLTGMLWNRPLAMTELSEKVLVFSTIVTSRPLVLLSYRLSDCPAFCWIESQDGWLWCFVETRPEPNSPVALNFWSQLLSVSLSNVRVVEVNSPTCWYRQDCLASRQGSWLSDSCSEHICLSQWHWQGKWTVLCILKFFTLSKQQAQLNTPRAYL